MMTRELRFDAAVAGIEPHGSFLRDEVEAARTNPSRYLLIEQNIGSSGDPSHWFTTHDTLAHAGRYHVGQEYAEDWKIVLALDLDTGTCYEGEISDVAWTEVA